MYLLNLGEALNTAFEGKKITYSEWENIVNPYVTWDDNEKEFKDATNSKVDLFKMAYHVTFLPKRPVWKEYESYKNEKHSDLYTYGVYENPFPPHSYKWALYVLATVGMHGMFRMRTLQGSTIEHRQLGCIDFGTLVTRLYKTEHQGLCGNNFGTTQRFHHSMMEWSKFDMVKQMCFEMEETMYHEVRLQAHKNGYYNPIQFQDNWLIEVKEK